MKNLLFVVLVIWLAGCMCCDIPWQVTAAKNIGFDVELRPTTVFVDGINVTDDWKDFRITFAIMNNLDHMNFNTENSLMREVWSEFGYITIEEELGEKKYLLKRHDGLEIIATGHYTEGLTLEFTITSEECGGVWVFNLME